MPAPRKYSSELRERAIRLVQEAQAQDAELSVNAAVNRIGQRVGVNRDTLRGWCRQSAIDAGQRLGTSTIFAKWLMDLFFLRALIPRHDLSYGIYLYAFPVQQATASMGFVGPHYWLITLIVSILATVGLAYLSWILIERPALSLKRRFV